MSPTFRSLRNRNYRLYAAGGVVSNIGTWMQRVAQDWLVLQLSDNDGVALGITTGLQFLPMLLFGPWGGMLADRYSKRKLLIVTQAFMGVVALVLGVLDLTGVVAGVARLRARRCCSASARPSTTRPGSRSWSRWSGRDDLPNAVGLNSASFNLGRVIGPALAGLLIAVVGTGPVFLINARLVRRRDRRADPDAHRRARRRRRAPGAGRGQVREGIRYVRGRPDLLMVMVAGVLRRHVRPELPDHHRADGDRGVRQGRGGVRAARLDHGGRLAGRRAARRPPRPAAAAAAAPGGASRSASSRSWPG